MNQQIKHTYKHGLSESEIAVVDWTGERYGGVHAVAGVVGRRARDSSAHMGIHGWVGG